jgi:hypothetical protein
MPQDQTQPAEAAAAMHRLLAGGWVTATHPPSLSRLQRALAAIGVVHETDDRRYSLTPLGASLRSDQPGSMRAWARFLLGEELGAYVAGTAACHPHRRRRFSPPFRRGYLELSILT